MGMKRTKEPRIVGGVKSRRWHGAVVGAKARDQGSWITFEGNDHGAVAVFEVFEAQPGIEQCNEADAGAVDVDAAQQLSHSSQGITRAQACPLDECCPEGINVVVDEVAVAVRLAQGLWANLGIVEQGQERPPAFENFLDGLQGEAGATGMAQACPFGSDELVACDVDIGRLLPHR